jgi:hypothetical protein
VPLSRPHQQNLIQPINKWYELNRENVELSAFAVVVANKEDLITRYSSIVVVGLKEVFKAINLCNERIVTF